MLYNRKNLHLARKMRKDGTKAEACLWKYVLRAKMMKGYSFRRQRPIANYIVDFLCKELMLVIEIDGSIHDLEEVRQKDKIRKDFLESHGFKVLRFTNSQVLKNITQVREQLEYWIEEAEKGNRI